MKYTFSWWIDLTYGLVFTVYLGYSHISPLEVNEKVENGVYFCLNFAQSFKISFPPLWTSIRVFWYPRFCQNRLMFLQGDVVDVPSIMVVSSFFFEMIFSSCLEFNCTIRYWFLSSWHWFLWNKKRVRSGYNRALIGSVCRNWWIAEWKKIVLLLIVKKRWGYP